MNTATGAFSPVHLDEYQERVDYDPNGNIAAYRRNGNPLSGMQPKMDVLTYHYEAGSNRLNHITDSVPEGNYTVDLDSQDPDNYEYDATGNLTKDEAEGITSVSWSVYGKITQIVKGSESIDYTYDAAGNRISKTANGRLTVYVRDAAGNVMSVYEKPADGALAQTETWLYGSSRLGVQTFRTVAPEIVNLAAGFEAAVLTTLTRGEKLFELSNHLGNVLATITDRKLQHSTDEVLDFYLADIKTANDYYPFGMLMPGRKVESEGYRYGFNGKENDNEVKGEGNQQDYGMRIYDPRVGRFLSVDPIANSYPYLTPYQFASNDPIRNIDIDGLEGGSSILSKELGGLERSWNNFVGDVKSTWRNLFSSGRAPSPNQTAPEANKSATKAQTAKADANKVKAEVQRDPNLKIDVSELTISDEGLQFIKEYESFKPNLYNDQANHATIGYGHLVHYGPVNADDKKGEFKDGLTEVQASDLLKKDIVSYEEIVRSNVSVNLSQYQYDALVAFVYNTGALKSTTLLKRVNSGSASADEIKEALLMWNKVTDPKTKGKVESKGLTNRRTDEAELYNEGDYKRSH